MSKKKQKQVKQNQVKPCPLKIVVTGGPSAGKTTFVEVIYRELGRNIGIAREAASLIYKGGFPRKNSLSGKIHAQKAIYYIQRELEAIAAEETETCAVLCDRGSLDSLAYWPGTEKEFYKCLDTSLEKELKRYHWVIHLDTATENYFDATNPIRIESHKEALALNEKIRSAWSKHPNRIIISNDNDFMEKLNKAKFAFLMAIDGKSLEEIQSTINAN